MANECTLVFETSVPIPMTCADGTGIEKGALLKLTDPATVIINSGANDKVFGIAAEEKIASNGKTKIGVYTSGIFKGTCAAAVTVGNALAISATANKLQHAVAASVGSATVGIALETTGGADETFLFELKPACNNTAYA
jgi:hypothetical protein